MSADSRAMPGPFSGLSVKLITTIIFVILAVEVVIYLPSVANFRANWLDDRLHVGIVAARVIDVVPDAISLPEMVTDRLLDSAGATAIVYRRDGKSQLITRNTDPMPKASVTADLRQRDPVTLILGALDTLAAPDGRTMRIVGDGDPNDKSIVEVLMPEGPLRHDMLIYSRNIFWLSLIIASVTAVAVFIILSGMLIRPIRRITANIVAFRQSPENASLIIDPVPRRNEIGVLEKELSAMQTDLFSMLRQRRHLADLGLAVAKINHDLRNTLTSAQLLSDQVANLDDPKVQRLAPRLVHTLDKAIGFAQAVLDYGRESAIPPRPVPVDLRVLIEEAIFDAGLVAHPEIEVRNEVPDHLTVTIDPDQMSRVFVNLLKNAREALESAGAKIAEPCMRVGYRATGPAHCLTFIDNGPGLPPRARENLFVAFEGSARAGGTGLGLAIARELTEANGGKLDFVPEAIGTRFDLELGLMRPARR